MIVIHKNKIEITRELWHVAIEDTIKTGMHRIVDDWIFKTEQEAIAKESQLKAHYEKN